MGSFLRLRQTFGRKSSEVRGVLRHRLARFLRHGRTRHAEADRALATELLGFEIGHAD